MRRSLPLLIGGSLLLFLACNGASESDSQTTASTQPLTAVRVEEDKTKKECPWTSNEDPSCAAGVSGTSCGNGTGTCALSAAHGCTCVRSVVAEPQPTEPVVIANSVRDTETPREVVTPVETEDKTTKECPWASNEDPSCKAGTSETSCGNGTGKCRVSGSAGCTCVSGTVATPVEHETISN